jgi:hypothetical protein
VPLKSQVAWTWDCAGPPHAQGPARSGASAPVAVAVAYSSSRSLCEAFLGRLHSCTAGAATSHGTGLLFRRGASANRPGGDGTFRIFV